MEKDKIELIMDELNDWTIEDLRELADQITTFADAIDSDEGEKE